MGEGCCGVSFIWIPKVFRVGHCGFVVPWLIRTVVCMAESELEGGNSGEDWS